jgi:hypothetical protein
MFLLNHSIMYHVNHKYHMLTKNILKMLILEKKILFHFVLNVF